MTFSYKECAVDLKKAPAHCAALLLGAPPSARAEILVGLSPASAAGVVDRHSEPKGLAAGQAYIGEIDGEKVRVIQLDDASDPTASTRNARKLVEQERSTFSSALRGRRKLWRWRPPRSR